MQKYAQDLSQRRGEAAFNFREKQKYAQDLSQRKSEAQANFQKTQQYAQRLDELQTLVDSQQQAMGKLLTVASKKRKFS